MKESLKGFAKDSICYAVGDWLNKLGSLILVPILSRIFLPSDYGIIDLLNNSYVFLLIMVGLNIDSGMQKFYYLREGEERNILISSSMLYRFLFSALITLLIVAFSGSLSTAVFGNRSYQTVISIAALGLPLDDLNGQLMLYLRLDRKPIAFSIFNMSQVIIQPLLTYILVVHFQTGIGGVFIAKLIVGSILTLPLLVNGRDYLTRKIEFTPAYLLMKFSLPGLGNGVQTTVINLLPAYFLFHFSTLTAVGLFGIADRIARSIDMFKSSFNRAWNPFAFANAGKADEKVLYEKVFKVFAGCLISLALLFTFFSREILSILTPSKYHSAAALVAGLSFYYSLRALPLIYSTGLYSVNKVGHTSLLSGIQLAVFIVSALFLVPRYAAGGLVFSLNAAAVVYFASYSLIVKRYFPFDFSSSRLLAMLTLGSLGAALALNVPSFISVTGMKAEFAYKLLIMFAYVASSSCIVLTKWERTQIVVKVKSMIAIGR